MNDQLDDYPKAWITSDGDFLCVLQQYRWDKMLEALNEALVDGGYGPVARPTDHVPFSVKHRHRFHAVPIEWMFLETWPDAGPTALSGKRVGVYAIPIEEVVIGDD